ncbi:MAG: polysaccharide biosynthesis tyrosine autokinase [Chloroflexi bacterium]|nr:polysaccharide biosynthesis tyrosine autokinase [Chloroflexota bacterium]
MDLEQSLRIGRRWWWLVISAAVLGGVATYLISTRITPSYEARTTLLVVQRQGEGVVQLNDLQTAERLANTFSRLVTLRPVLDRSIQDGNLPFDATGLAIRLNVTNPRGTQLLVVTARASSPELAARISNTVARAFISSNEAALTSRPGQVSVVEEALPSGSPVSQRLLLNTALGMVLFALAATVIVTVIEYLDDTVKSGEKALEQTGLPILARIEQFGRLRNAREQLQAANRPRSTIAEAYRAARTNLSYAINLGQDRRLVLITSPGLGEGKTTTTANLAIVFGLAGHRVCVVDTDLRRPTMHKVFGIDNATGLTTLLLARERDVGRLLVRSLYTNVTVLPSGPMTPNPSELLGSARMREILDGLRDRFDVVLMDSPPALVVTDASVLGMLSDGLVIVARAGKTRIG